MAGAIFLLGCYADVSENKIFFAGNKKTPANITVLKILRYGTARVDSRVQFVWRLQPYGLLCESLLSLRCKLIIIHKLDL